MAQLVRIQCINKSDRQESSERIKSVGGINPNGTPWKLSEAEAIAGILAGKWEFYVERPPGQRVGVIVAISAHGRQYLRTVADGETPNNLLSLPECP